MSHNVFNQIAVADFGYSNSFYDQAQRLSRKNIQLIEINDNIAEQESIAEVDALIISWKSKITAKILEIMPNLRYIGTRSTSTGHVDKETIEQRGITLTNIVGYGDQSTAEFVIQQLLFLAREASAEALPMELSGKTLGLLGFGHIAKKVAIIAQSLGMDVRFFTPSASANKEPRMGIPFIDKQVLLTSDFLSIHTPDYEATLSLDELKLIAQSTRMIITTLGLPFHLEDFIAWQHASPHLVVMDMCTAQNHDLRDLIGVTVKNSFAARSQESVIEAENQLINNIKSYLSFKE